MNHAQQLESDAVVSTEIDRQGRGTGAADEAHRRIAPLWIGQERGRRVPLRYFACGKNGEHASLLQPRQCFADRLAVGFTGAICLERIDENTILLQFRNVSEDGIGENLHVRPNTFEKDSE